MQPPGEHFGIVGGGMLIDALRNLDQCHQLSQDAMHWRCIRTLDATFEVASELIPEFKPLASAEELHVVLTTPPREIAIEKQAYWLKLSAFYTLENQSRSANSPAIGWQTTSDSLALYFAHQIKAERCVIFKSCRVAHLRSLATAFEAGIVDAESMRFQSLIPTIELLQL